MKDLKVAIIGYAMGREKAPYGDAGWEIWGINEIHKFDDVTRLDLLLDIHPRTTTDRFEYHKEFLRTTETPILMLEDYEDYPASEAFPIADITARFGTYFTNSISYLIALAILRGATEIGLYGVDMASDEELAVQMPSCEYFIGIARGLGIVVDVPEESDMLQCPGLYGYDDKLQGEWFETLRCAFTKSVRGLRKTIQSLAEQVGEVEQAKYSWLNLGRHNKEER